MPPAEQNDLFTCYFKYFPALLCGQGKGQAQADYKCLRIIELSFRAEYTSYI